MARAILRKAPDCGVLAQSSWRLRAMPTSLLLHAFARRATPLTFSDLAGALAGTGAMLSDLAAALAAAMAQETVVACGFAGAADGSRLGPRLLILSDRGHRAVAADRISSDQPT